MDGPSFDILARLAATGASRRKVLTSAGLAALGLASQLGTALTRAQDESVAAPPRQPVGGDGSVFCGACAIQGCDCEVKERRCGPFDLFFCVDRRCVNCHPEDSMFYNLYPEAKR